MTYGIAAQNENGEELFGGPLYWIRQETTTSVRSRSYYLSNGATSRAFPCLALINSDLSFQGPLEPLKFMSFTQTAQANTVYDHYVSNGFLTATGENYKIPVAAMAPDELTFIELDSNGIITMAQVWNILPEYTEGGALHVASWGTSTALNAYICSTTPGSPVGNYGMKIFGADGSLEFDSRSKYPRVQDHFYVSKATAQDILINGTTVDLTLSSPVASPKVSCPHWCQAQRNLAVANNSQTAFVRMRKLNDTTIRLDRVGEPGSGGSSFAYRWTHDAYIVVAH